MREKSHEICSAHVRIDDARAAVRGSYFTRFPKIAVIDAQITSTHLSAQMRIKLFSRESFIGRGDYWAKNKQLDHNKYVECWLHVVKTVSFKRH